MKNKRKDNPICCICGKKCENIYGNNPYPVVKKKNAVCCNNCNKIIVISKRTELHLDELIKTCRVDPKTTMKYYKGDQK